MRHSKALLALSTLLFTAVAHATASSSSSSSNPLAERDSFPELLKRHGGDVYSCSSSSYHLVHSSGNGCACKSSVRNGETKCPPPKKGHCGVSKCSSGKGCVIECNAGMQLNKHRDDCECMPGYTLASSGTYCKPQCGDNEKWNGHECVCVPGCKKNKNRCEPSCDKYEIWNGKECVCKPSCGRRNNKCQPQCKDNETYDDHKHQCVCKPGFTKKGNKCVAQCGENQEWCDEGHKCKCKPGFELKDGKCKPKPHCPEGQKYDDVKHKCVCKEGLELKDGKCKPRCGENEEWSEWKKRCVCKETFVWKQGHCKPRCDEGEMWNGHKCMCKPGYVRHGHICIPGASSVPRALREKRDAAVGASVQHANTQREKRSNSATPVWSSKLHTREQDGLFCPDGLSACPIDSTLGGYECVDTRQELENCGGCTADGTGKDCTTITGAAGVGCHAGQCIVLSCVDSHRLSSSGECVLVADTRRHKSKRQA